MIARIISLLAVGLLLAACDPQDLPVQTRAPICHALIGPIRYDTYHKSSQRYAAAVLALDLKQRNRVYIKLGCASFRRLQ